MQTVQIPPLSAADVNRRVVCPEGCAVWVGAAGRPWWIYSGGISTCAVCILYEFNSPTPQIYYYHFIAPGAALLNDFNQNLPPRVANNMGLFRARIYRNTQLATANTNTRVQNLQQALANANQVGVFHTNAGFNVRFADGTFTDGVAGAGGLGHLANWTNPINTFNCMKEVGGVAVAKTLPANW